MLRTIFCSLSANFENENPTCTSHGIGRLRKNGPHSAYCHTWRISWFCRASRRVYGSSSWSDGIITFDWSERAVAAWPVLVTDCTTTAFGSVTFDGFCSTMSLPRTSATVSMSSSPGSGTPLLSATWTDVVDGERRRGAERDADPGERRAGALALGAGRRR